MVACKFNNWNAFNYGFFENKPSVGNYIFYTWFLVSLYFLVAYLRRKWKV